MLSARAEKIRDERRGIDLAQAEFSGKLSRRVAAAGVPEFLEQIPGPLLLPETPPKGMPVMNLGLARLRLHLGV